MTKPGPEQQPRRSSRRASRRNDAMRAVEPTGQLCRYRIPAQPGQCNGLRGLGGFQPQQPLQGAAAAGQAAGQPSAARTPPQKGNSAGSTLARQSAVPEANPPPQPPVRPAAVCPAPPLLPPPRAVGFAVVHIAHLTAYIWVTVLRGEGTAMKPKKPHPRKHHGRPDLRHMLAPPPQGFTACRRWNCGAAAY